MSDIFVILVTLGAVARITRFVTADHMRPFVWLRRQIQKIPVLGEMIIVQDDGSLVGCDWCVSIWIGAAIITPLGVLKYDQPWWLIAFEILAASMAIGWLTSLERD